MTIQLSKSRRGLYTIKEYITFRGNFKDSSNNLIPLPDDYEPIIYMKCLKHSHLFPVQPEAGNRFIDYNVFKNRDLQKDPLSCPVCGEQDLCFKYCELEDQPRTWNDSNHRFIKDWRYLTKHPFSSYYGKAESMMGIARPDWEDYFPPSHTNNKDPFAEHEVYEKSKDPKFYASGTQISQAIVAELNIPDTDIYDLSGVYLIKKKGSDFHAHPAVPAAYGKYTKIKQNYDFYRAILYIITQYNI